MDKKLVAGIVVLVLVIAAFGYFTWSGADAKDKAIPVGLQSMLLGFNSAAARYQQSLGQNYSALDPHPLNSSSCGRVRAVWNRSDPAERLAAEEDWLDCFDEIAAYTNFSSTQLSTCRQTTAAMHAIYSKAASTPDFLYAILPREIDPENVFTYGLPADLEKELKTQVRACNEAS